MEASLHPRVFAKHLHDRGIDFVIGQYLRSIICLAIKRRMGGKPEAAGFLVQKGRPFRELAKCLAEDRQWIRQAEKFEIPPLFRFGRKLGRILLVEVVEGLDRSLARLLPVGVERLEEPAADNFIRFVPVCGDPR